MTRKIPASGPKWAKIMIVGEAPGSDEERAGAPFVGKSGIELTRMLDEAGIRRADCFITNVCKYRPWENDIEQYMLEAKGKINKNPPQLWKLVNGYWCAPELVAGLAELEDEIKEIKPNLIIAFGNTPLWALTGNKGITKWRGSVLWSEKFQVKVVPTYHPAAILRQWSWRYIAVNDLRRALSHSKTPDKLKVEENFIIRPTFYDALFTLGRLHKGLESGEIEHLSIDLETRQGMIACIGIAWSGKDAICIPLLCTERPLYFEPEDFLPLWEGLKEIFEHPRARFSFQNGVYDKQYLSRWLGLNPKIWRDTMITHHVMFAGLPKGLDFLSSLYLDDHVYWKDEGKTWDRSLPEDQLWTYNCKDATRTFRIAEIQSEVLRQINLPTGLHGNPLDIQHEMNERFFMAMLRGIKVDRKKKSELLFLLQEEIRKREEFINFCVGRPFNVRSTKQMPELFYTELGMKTKRNYKTGGVTCNEEALLKIAVEEPALAPFIEIVLEVRSLTVFASVCAQSLDHDGRMRCTYQVAGTETYRLSSSEDAFGFGTNLQNVSTGDEEPPPGTPPEKRKAFYLPNLRTMFIPDEGYIIGEFDFEQADARVVAWEADDDELIQIFLDPKSDLHTENAKAIFGTCSGKSDPRRQKAKAGVHLTNYGGTPPVLAKTLGVTVREAEDFQDRWFAAHPKIKKWQDSVLYQLQTRRYVENKFGYRRFYFDRIEAVFKEALAWIPQSTVGIAVNLGIRRTEQSVGYAELLTQTHDSAGWQWPRAKHPEAVDAITRSMRVEIPYPRPLYIPVKPKWSEKSWGECK